MAEQVSVLPFLNCSDILLSEASSVLFEFAALNKPIIWIDFLKLRWSYRGIFRFRFERRMDQTIVQYHDIARHVSTPKELSIAIRQQLLNPSEYELPRLKATNELIGVVDGAVSERIVGYFEGVSMV
jgi:CDP-glycerol glycerophosphotransferase (TagB/SpsB family)